MSAAPTKKHQRLSYRLTRVVGDFVAHGGFGELYVAPVDVRLATNGIVQPDLLFVRRDRVGIYRASGLVEGAPDVVIEILSPSSRGIDLVRKAALYAREGVPEYWVADPDALALTVYALGEGRYEPGTVRSLVLTGVVVELGELFAGL